MKAPIPHATVVEIVDLIRQRDIIVEQQRATQAEMIRGCVQKLRADPNTYRMRGHEGFADAARIRKENRENQELAFVYLEWLATQLENASGDLTLSSN